MELEWTSLEKRKIFEDYWETHSPRCPRDNARIDVVAHQTIKPPPPDFFFRCPQCGRHFDSSRLEKEVDPETFEGRYETAGVVGEGGMGQVLLVRSCNGGELFAAKQILPHLLGQVDTVKRFQREGRILAQLQHENVVPIRETYIDERRGVIVMEYVTGGTLTDAINNMELDRAALVAMFSGVNEGLKYLHGRGVIHRDLKPGNVLLRGGRVACISDFGLSRLVDRDSTSVTIQGRFLGTPLYAAPEQRLDAKEVTTKCDVFSLALVAYEIATRRSPYSMPISSEGLSEPLRAALTAALAQNPSDRPLTGDDLVAALRAWANS